jgi:hypothetical protein
MSELKKGPRGLPAIARLREERSRRGSRWTMQAGLVAAGAVLVSLVAHTFVSRRDLESGKRALIAKQNAVRVTLGVDWFALRDRLEQDAVRAAGPYRGDHVETEARGGAFRTQPGLYLRMRMVDAQTTEGVARAALTSQRDGVVACLLREPNERGARGDLDAGAFAEQPWNLGQAYWATRILLPDWSSAIEETDDAMRLRLYSAQYDEAMSSEIPLAVDILQRAKFFLLVLDEASPDASSPDGGPDADEAALQLLGHPARVFLFDTSTGRELLRLRRSGQGRVLQVGESFTTDQETRDAMQRQANNCSLGRQVEEALRAPGDAGPDFPL